MSVRPVFVGCVLLGAASVTGAQVVHVPNYPFGGNAVGNQFGFSVSGAGDVNNDGYDDLIVGVPSESLTGAAYVFCGRTGAVLHSFFGDVSGDSFGSSVSGAGDFNNDGFDDVVVGATNATGNAVFSGIARVFCGATGATLATFLGEASGNAFGFSVGGAGDVNNDGFDDVIVGAPFNSAAFSSAGRAYVYSGATGALLYTFDGEAFGDTLGRSVSGAGDVNGDGFDDVIVGADGNDANGPNSGRAYVYSGDDGSLLHVFTGDAAGDRLGHSVSGAGDVNGDGFDDVIVGIRLADNTGMNSGSARVFSGVDGSVLYTFDGDAAGDEFGWSVSGAGDVNGDGFDDVIVGARSAGNNGPNSGSARVFCGATGAVLHTWIGDAGDDRFGFSVSGAGDVNGDGFADLIVGAPDSSQNGPLSGLARVFVSVATGCPPPPCPGDADGNGVVDIDDITFVILRLGTSCP